MPSKTIAQLPVTSIGKSTRTETHLHTMSEGGYPGEITYRKQLGKDTTIIAQVGNTRIAISCRKLLAKAAKMEKGGKQK